MRLKPEAGFKGYFDRGGQRIRHLAPIRERYGFTEFADNGAARFCLTRWLYALCWSGDDHPGPLIARATSWLVVNKVLLPGVSVLERFVGRIRDRAQKRLWQRLVAALDEKQPARIAALFDETNEAGFTALDALRTVPKQRTSGELLLGRRIHHGERGEIRSPLQQGQEEQLGSLGLALNAVVHWNAIYMQEAVQQIKVDDMDVGNDDLVHLSPLIWRHLNFLGRYDFSLPATVLNGGLRPLRNPTSAWEF